MIRLRKCTIVTSLHCTYEDCCPCEYLWPCLFIVIEYPTCMSSRTSKTVNSRRIIVTRITIPFPNARYMYVICCWFTTSNSEKITILQQYCNKSSIDKMCTVDPLCSAWAQVYTRKMMKEFILHIWETYLSSYVLITELTSHALHLKLWLERQKVYWFIIWTYSVICMHKRHIPVVIYLSVLSCCIAVSTSRGYLLKDKAWSARTLERTCVVWQSMFNVASPSYREIKS